MDNRPSASKVAIPRLGHDRKSPQNRHGKSRARKACDNCRKRKVRRDCLKEFVSRTLGIASLIPSRATEQNSELIALLKDLATHVDDGGKKKIDELFNSLRDNSSTHTPTIALETLRKRSREGSLANKGSRYDPSLRETRISRLVSLNNNLNLLDKDLLRSRKLRATSFFRQNSEVQWLRGLKSQVESASLGRTPDGLPYRPPGSSRAYTSPIPAMTRSVLRKPRADCWRTRTTGSSKTMTFNDGVTTRRADYYGSRAILAKAK
ncbi:hypothetical protein V2W45_1329248 [Cenococcum geophilum]